jgi:adenylate cyclase class 2
LRFDTPDGELTKARRTLRLRKDTEARLTYKDGGQTIKGAISRREIEFVVSDFEEAKQFIEALGYETVFIYEKYRTTYEASPKGLKSIKGLKSLKSPMAKIMVDELPYGNFVEIEGDLEMLRPIAKELGLDWSKAIPASYFMLFERLHKARRLKFRDLTFGNFKGIKVKPEEMGIEYADQQK